jgi:hypothetical protein
MQTQSFVTLSQGYNVIKHFFFVTGVGSLAISLNFRKNFFPLQKHLTANFLGHPFETSPIINIPPF